MDAHDTYPPIEDELLIDDLEDLKQLANPIRLRLLFYFQTPRSVAEVAREMGVPVTRLYYHVRILEAAGAIAPVATRKRGPQLETIYRIVARSLRPSAEIMNNDDTDPGEFAEITASLILDSTRAELIDALRRHAERGFDPSDFEGSIGRTIVELPRSVGREFIQRLEGLIMEAKTVDHEGDDHAIYGITYSMVMLEPTEEGTTS